MSAVPHTAMILAAGRGSRMRPLTDTKPKPLIEVAGQALIDRCIDPLIEAGVKRFVVNVHWLADQVEAHFQARSGLDVVFSDERDIRLETGGALAKARPILGDDPIFVINTDAFWAPQSSAPILQLADAYAAGDSDILLLLADTRRALGYDGPGDVFLDDEGKVRFRGDAASAPWAYAGVRITRPSLYDNAPLEAFSAVNIWKAVEKEGRLKGIPLDAFWLHVGDPQALENANMWMRFHGA